MLIGLSLNTTEERLERIFQAKMKVPLLYQPYYYLSSEVYPGLFCIPSESPIEIYPMELGLVPSDAEDIEEFRYDNPNKNFFPISKLTEQHKRCLILATGFVLPKVDYKLNKKVPFYYHLKKDVFCLAGIYEEIKPNYYTTAIVISENFPLVLKNGSEFEYLRGKGADAVRVVKFSAHKLNPDIYYKDGDYNRRESLLNFG